MKRNSKNKVIVCLVAMIVLAIVSLCIEIFIFNFEVLVLPDEEKGEHNINLETLVLQDIDYDETDDTFYVVGANPVFSIDEVQYISYLKMALDPTSPSVHIGVSGSDKTYDLNSSRKEQSILQLRCTSKGLTFSVEVDDGSNSFRVTHLVVDNSVTINWLRVLLVFSVGIIIVYFVLFRDLVFKKLHVTFLVLALVLGINMSVFIPTYYAYDELQHFIRAYELANFDFGIIGNKEINWIENIEEFFYFSGDASVTHNTYPEFVEFINKYNSNQYTHSAYYNSTAITYPFIPYIFSGIGIIITKILNMPFVVLFYFGRIYGLIGYSLVCYLAIKYAKIGKRLMFLIALFPVSIFSASAYSADPLTLAFSLLSVTIFINMICAEKSSIGYDKPILFAICVSIMTMCKVTYAPFCALILSVSGEKFQEKKKAVWSKIFVFVIVGVVACMTLFLATYKGLDQWKVPGVNAGGQILFILKNIIFYMRTMISHVTKNMLIYFTGSITALAYCGNLNTIWLVAMIVLLFVMTIIDEEEKSICIQIKEKFFLTLIIVASWSLVLTALYLSFTPVGSREISGVQGRYFAPLLLPILLLFKTTKISCGFTEKQLNILTIYSGFLVLLVAVIKVFSGYCL